MSWGGQSIIFGDGGQTWDFVHVSDVVDAIITSLRNERARCVFNIGSVEATTINEATNLIARLAGREYLKPTRADEILLY
ncbi:MAG: NAD-dependent epimerase/dehydratase family protein [Pyrobaculum sp.]